MYVRCTTKQNVYTHNCINWNTPPCLRMHHCPPPAPFPSVLVHTFGIVNATCLCFSSIFAPNSSLYTRCVCIESRVHPWINPQINASGVLHPRNAFKLITIRRNMLRIPVCWRVCVCCFGCRFRYGDGISNSYEDWLWVHVIQHSRAHIKGYTETHLSTIPFQNITNGRRV